MREWSTLRKLMLTKGATGAPLREYTATGNPLKFNTNKAKPLKSLTIPWTPVQSGTGDPSPENIRPISGVSALNVWQTGKNLIDDSKKYQQSTSMVFVGATDNGRDIFLKAGKYTVTRDFNGQSIGLYYIKRDATTEKSIFSVSSTDTTKVITIEEDGYYGLFAYRSVASGGVSVSDIKSVMVEVGESASDYSPYTGTTKSIVFPALGKNLLNIEDTDKVNPGATGSTITIANGVISIDAVATSARSYVVFAQEFSAGTYTIQAKNSGAVGKPQVLSDTEFEGSSYSSYYKLYTKTVGSSGTLTFTLTEKSKIGLVLPNLVGEAGNPGTLYDIMLNTGESAQTYEPYTNTVYGGSLDVVSGVLTVEWICKSANQFTWTQNSYGWWSATTSGQDEKKHDNTSIIADQYTTTTSRLSDMQDCTIRGNAANGNIVLRDDSFSSAEEVSQGTFHICYELANPVEIQLTPTQITALLGDNVIWSDTNGTNTAIYFKKG